MVRPFYVFSFALASLILLTYIFTIPAPIIASIIASIVAILGFTLQKLISREKNSLDFEASYKHNKTIVEAFRATKELRTAKKLPISKYIQLSDDLDLLLNEWESVANGILSKTFDEKLLYRAYGSTIINMYDSFQPYIIYSQQENPKYFLMFTRLAIQWKVRRLKEKSIQSNLLHSNLKELHTAATNLNLALNESYPYNPSKKQAIKELQKREQELIKTIKSLN
ncbi:MULTISPECIES: DUF4760 domain-containing protein [Pseudoalteromonas]|uniref:DUF4760 domain-containing protein n=1 Tax=Pseudoalteromonas undina TaxID=43660 RepID=A0ACC6R020_9GAMM|nr:DUF4760 domain-containing protein [Pseudoalteromonas sp. P1-7a]KPZ58072.1 hypothetical protein AN389_03081 [Pseudoalteromonas sp. P1-7a]